MFFLIGMKSDRLAVLQHAQSLEQVQDHKRILSQREGLLSNQTQIWTLIRGRTREPDPPRESYPHRRGVLFR